MHHPAASYSLQQHSWHKFLFLVVKISVEKIFLLNIEQWTNISPETRPRPQQPLTKCPGIEVTAKADLLCGNLKGCKVQDFPAQTCVKEKAGTSVCSVSTHHQTARCSPSWTELECPPQVLTYDHLQSYEKTSWRTHHVDIYIIYILSNHI